VRIILAVHAFYPRSGGGTEVYTLALARGLRRHGHEVEILTCQSNRDGEPRAIRSEDHSWEDIPVHALSFNVLDSPNPILYDDHNPWIQEYLTGFYAERQVDLVHICHPGNLSLSVLTAAKGLGRPVVMTATDFWTICPTSQLLRHDRTLCPGPVDTAHCLICTVTQRETAERYRALVERIPLRVLRGGLRLARGPWARVGRPGRMVQALDGRAGRIRQTLEQADQIISPSRFLRDQLQANGVPAAKIVVSPHGIDVRDLELGEVRSRRGSALRFAFVGQIAWHKGVHVAVEAFGHLPVGADATLTLYGEPQEPDYMESLQARIAADPSISYRGTFPHRQIGEVLSEVDVLLMPSMWYENTPTIMYEAFATRTPVIASHQGGMVELIEDFRGGWTFPRGEIGALAELMAALANHPKRVSKARTAIRPVRTIDEHVADVLEIYASVSGWRGEDQPG
jgi:glycosyltransferase involved in cell wall biosynthesis